MSVAYQLVNQTRREVGSFQHLGASPARELAGNSGSAAATTWYLLQRRGDAIAFVSDLGEWPFASGRLEDVRSFTDVTEQVVTELIAAGVLADHGIRWVDEDEPEVYVRDLRNVWMP